VFANNAVGFISIGTPVTTYTTPFGIDVADYSTAITYCTFSTEVETIPDVQGPPPPKCTNSSTSSVTPAVTSFSNGTVTSGTRVYTVGSQPTVVRLFDIKTVNIFQDGSNWTRETSSTGPLYALTTNFGSNTVSVITLASGAVSSIPVGTEPLTAMLDSSQANAYVTNYGSATVSQINLSSFTQTRSIAVGASPSALALDPSGTALWVGGLNYIEEISLSTYTPIANFTVTGQVTSLAISQGENSLVYSTVSTTSGSYQSQNANVANGATVATYEQVGTLNSDFTRSYAVSVGSHFISFAGSLPPYLVSSGAMVSAYYGNRYAVMATPTGFDLYDLQTNTVMFSTPTSGPVRGIAIDPAFSVAYLTIADTNTVLQVPLPATQ
jgi:YVTN family beta-propeller protein